jgi:hypothetical protein
MKIIEKFLARIRREKFARNIEREIFHKIFPHNNGHADHGYPFSSKDELHKARLKGSIELWKTLRALDSAALKMPESECNAFLYIVNRDLEERLRMYLKYINAHKNNCEPLELQPVPAAA